MKVDNDIMWYFPRHYVSAKKIAEDEPKEEKKQLNLMFTNNKYFFWFLRVTGMFPIQIDGRTGKIKYGIKTWSFIVTVGLQVTYASINAFTLPILGRNFIEIGFTVEERIVYFLLFTFLWLQAMMLLLFFESGKLAHHLNLWGQFSDQLIDVTKKPIEKCHSRLVLISYLLSIASIASLRVLIYPTYIQVVENHHLEQPIHDIMFNLVMASGGVVVISFALFWTIFMKAIELSANAIISDIESLSWKIRHRSLSKHLNLWIHLRQICNNVGSALGITYTYFCASMFLFSILTLLLAIDQIKHGAYINLVSPIISIGIMTFLAEVSQSVMSMMGQKFEERLGAILMSGQADDYQTELVNFMQTVASTAPSVSVGGYFTIDRGINVGARKSGPMANTNAPPQWLTQDFLQSAIQEGGRRGSISVSSYTIKPATNVGDNYFSQMFRASVKVSSAGKGTEDLPVIIKCMPLGKAVEEFVNEMKYFTRETKILAEALPLLQEQLDEIGGPKIYPHLYFKQGAPNNTLMMEDLCASGFRNVNRHAGLDMDHSLLVMEYIATLQAASLAAIAKNPKMKETYEESFWQRRNVLRVKAWIDQDIENLLTYLKSWNFPDEMILKVERWSEIGMEKVFKLTDLKDDELNVLSHGDLWTSNIMFKYEDDTPIDLRFIDFQQSFYNTAAFDLLYLIFSSTQIDIRLSRLDEMLTRYHEKLVEACSKLKYPLNITLAETKNMFYDRLVLGFLTTFVILPFIITDPTETTDMNEYLEKGQADRGQNLAKNEKYKKVIETVLPFFDQHGVFD